MKMNKISAGLFAAAIVLSACSDIEDSVETDTIPVMGDNIITSESEAPPSSSPISSENRERPAETWTETDEKPDGAAESPKTPHEGGITEIELTYYNVTLEPEESSMPIVTMYPEDAPDKSEIWNSSDEDVAVVDDMGNITAVSEGSCVVRVQSAASPEVFAEVNVTVSSDEDVITEIELTYYNVTLEPEESSMPIVTMYPEDAPDKSEIWSSSDESVAVVDDMGNITAVSDGRCVVKVQSAASPEVFAEVNVTVSSDGKASDEKDAGSPELTYIDGILIANKSYPLPSDYNPGVDPDAQAAFDKMQSAAADDGLNIYISSGFRSYDYQAKLYEGYVEKSGKAEADRYSARPGHSEHQTGLAFDLNSIDMSFADTEEYKWVSRHCAEYGFIIRYPEDGESVTGYMYEPWHIRYLGADTAKKVYDSGLTLEEYLGIDSKYDE